MFNPTKRVIKDFTRELTSMYEETYGILEPSYPGVISFVARLALENIATSDAAYHDVNHTIMHYTLFKLLRKANNGLRTSMPTCSRQSIVGA